MDNVRYPRVAHENIRIAICQNQPEIVCTMFIAQAIDVFRRKFASQIRTNSMP